MDQFQELATVAVGELDSVFKRMDDSHIRPLTEAVKSHKRIFTVGAGREGLSTKSFAMRLTHLGKESHWIWDDTTPGIGGSDLLVAACGSGNVDHVCRVIEKARAAGADIALVTAGDGGAAASMADIVTVLPAQAFKAQGDFVATRQPMGNLFEQALYILFDLVVMLAARELGIPPEAMEQRHRNVE